MNVAIDHHDVSLEVTGVLGETVVPVVDANDRLVVTGMEAIVAGRLRVRTRSSKEEVDACCW